MNPCVNILLVSSNHQPESTKDVHVFEYRFTCEIYTLYAGAAGIVLKMGGKFTIGTSSHLLSTNWTSIGTHRQLLTNSE